MKQKIFTLLMMLALVIVAGNAMAQANTTVTAGGTYTYTLSDITVNTAGSATIAFDGDASEEVTIVSGFDAADQSSPYTAPTGTYNGVFKVKFSNSAITGNLVVTITDGASSGCSNHISLAITVEPAPSFDLTIAASEDQYCQTTATTTNNKAATFESVNTITYTVSLGTVTHAPSGGYTWGYTINIPNTTSPLSTYVVKRGVTTLTMPYAVTGIPSTSTTDDITVTFYSTTGLAPQTLTGTETLGKITDLGVGAATYDETTSGDNDAVTIKAVPSIGSFQ